jgi:hypothetical protein
MAAQVQFMNISEELFASYLDAAKYPWDYEQAIQGQTKKPDFRIRHTGVELLCDVKQRNATELPEGGGNANPVRRVRELLNKGIKKFKGFDDHLCAVVVYNDCDWQTSLYPFVIFGAMLGDPGIQLDFSPETGTLDPDSAQNVFLRRHGKFIRHYEPLDVYDTPRNISAVIALETEVPKNPVFAQAEAQEVRRRTIELGKPLNGDDRIAIVCGLTRQMRATLPQIQKVTVCLNPFARHPLPDDLFIGDYDQRWAIVGDTMQRVFAGTKVESSDED